MKRLIISLVLLFFALFSAFFSSSFIQNENEQFYSALTECENHINNEETEKAEESIKKLNSLWDDNRIKYKLVADKFYCDEIDSSLDSLSFNFSEGEFYEAKKNINLCRETLSLIEDEAKLSVEHIL